MHFHFGCQGLKELTLGTVNRDRERDLRLDQCWLTAAVIAKGHVWTALHPGNENGQAELLTQRTERRLRAGLQESEMGPRMGQALSLPVPLPPL